MELTEFKAMTAAESVCYRRTGTTRGDILSFVMPFGMEDVSGTRTELRIYLDQMTYRVSAADLTHLLGFSVNVGTTWLMRRYVPPEGRRLCIVADTAGRQRKMWLLNPYGVMALLSGVGTMEAKVMARYFKEAVFPLARQECAKMTP